MSTVGKERDRERRGRKKKEWKPMGRGAVFGDPWYMVMRPMGGQASSGPGKSLFVAVNELVSSVTYLVPRDK